MEYLIHFLIVWVIIGVLVTTGVIVHKTFIGEYPPIRRIKIKVFVGAVIQSVILWPILIHQEYFD